MTGSQFCMLMLILVGIVTIPGILLFLLTHDWNRNERIEQAMEYDPEPIHGQGRFANADDLRRAGW